MSNATSTALSPTQQQAFEILLQVLPTGHVFELHGPVGVGKSTVLRQLHQQLGGVLLHINDLAERQHGQHPLALEETFGQLVMESLQAHDVVLVDDLQLLSDTVHTHGYPRMGWVQAVLVTLMTYAIEAQKTLILCSNYPLLQHRALAVSIKELEVGDYSFLCHQYLPSEIAKALDYEKIFRFASKLNAYQLKNICVSLRHGMFDTEQFIDYLRSQQLSSNVDLGEVQTVELSALKGLDDVLQSLEANIIIPLENDELAEELQLKPKRGVLLAGPPGTGKTTIGRALAHRLRSKFFLIDGTFISGTGHFYQAIHQVFEAAKQNAPAIVFIDDSDVIFESGEELGLYRYLLTLLDGLESQSVGRVCVIMTAMNVSNLPPALVRSGRIELWLETRLPDHDARASILATHLKRLPAALSDVDIARLVSETEGFTGADLKRLIEDGKTLYAYDRVRNHDLRSPTEYFLAAVESVLTNKARYAEAEAHARAQRANPAPSVGDYMEVLQYVDKVL
jgi:ATP-dependent 26S proteasome regulatory subunit